MADEDKIAHGYAIPAISIDKPYGTWTTIRKSRFLAQTCHCPTPMEARQFITSVSQLYPQASHNCWAYVAGPPGDTSRVGCSDDGEPHGTAGKPMLSALLNSNIGEICAVVTRWFGGIKLGTGGLVRAYQGAVIDNLGSMPVQDFIVSSQWNIVLPYNKVDNFNRMVSVIGGKIIREEYGEKVNLTLKVPIDKSRQFNDIISQLRSNEIKISIIDK